MILNWPGSRFIRIRLPQPVKPVARWSRGICVYSVSRLILALLIAAMIYLKGELADAQVQQVEHARQAERLKEAGISVPVLNHMSRDYGRSAEWSEAAIRAIRVILGIVLLIAAWSVWEMTAAPYYRAEVAIRWVSPLLLLVFESFHPAIGWFLVFMSSVVEASVRLAIRKISQQSGIGFTGMSKVSVVGWDIIVILSSVVLAFAGAAMNLNTAVLIRLCLLIVVGTSLLSAIHFVSLLKMGLALRDLSQVSPDRSGTA